MGKFDGILLCSDWDGTISDGGVLLHSNIEAIRYFQKEGGKFTFASGRYAGHFKQFAKEILPNTYIIGVGGSCIMTTEGDIVYECFCNERFEEYARFLLRKDSPFEYAEITQQNHDPVRLDKKSIALDEGQKILSSLKIYKGIFITNFTKEAELSALQYVKDFVFDGYMPVRSFPYSLELIPKNGGKGAAVSWLAQKIKAKMVVAIGDYENDCDMLKVADYGYAVTGGSPLARAAANRFSASVKDGAIASVIEDLDREIT